MRKKTKVLSGASQDAYFRRVLKAHPNLPAGERDQLVRKLHEEVAQLRVRVEPRRDGEAEAQPVPAAARPQETVAPEPRRNPRAEPAGPRPGAPAASTAAPPFDPFSLNVVVVVRKSGREAALAALGAIDSLNDLRLLAREQRLTVATDLSTAAEVRAAIVAAAERRIANRMAAAG